MVPVMSFRNALDAAICAFVIIYRKNVLFLMMFVSGKVSTWSHRVITVSIFDVPDLQCSLP